jgi:hypothetical protein
MIAPRVRLVDISEGGAQLEVPWAVPVGSRVKLQLCKVHPLLRNSLAYQVVAVRSVALGVCRIHGQFVAPRTGVCQEFRAAMDEMVAKRV